MSLCYHSLYFKPDSALICLCSGARFKYRKTGMAVARQICNDNSYGVTVDSNVYEPHVTASTMAHVLGHVIGMGHDDRESRALAWGLL